MYQYLYVNLVCLASIEKGQRYLPLKQIAAQTITEPAVCTRLKVLRGSLRKSCKYLKQTSGSTRLHFVSYLNIAEYLYSPYDMCRGVQFTLCSLSSGLKTGYLRILFKLRHMSTHFICLQIVYFDVNSPNSSRICLKLIFCEVPFSEPLYYFVYLSHVAFKFWILLCMHYRWIGLCTLHSHLSTI